MNASLYLLAVLVASASGRFSTFSVQSRNGRGSSVDNAQSSFEHKEEVVEHHESEEHHEESSHQSSQHDIRHGSQLAFNSFAPTSFVSSQSHFPSSQIHSKNALGNGQRHVTSTNGWQSGNNFGKKQSNSFVISSEGKKLQDSNFLGIHRGQFTKANGLDSSKDNLNVKSLNFGRQVNRIEKVNGFSSPIPSSSQKTFRQNERGDELFQQARHSLPSLTQFPQINSSRTDGFHLSPTISHNQGGFVWSQPSSKSFTDERNINPHTTLTSQNIKRRPDQDQRPALIHTARNPPFVMGKITQGNSIPYKVSTAKLLWQPTPALIQSDPVFNTKTSVSATGTSPALNKWAPISNSRDSENIWLSNGQSNQFTNTGILPIRPPWKLPVFNNINQRPNQNNFRSNTSPVKHSEIKLNISNPSDNVETGYPVPTNKNQFNRLGSTSVLSIDGYRPFQSNVGRTSDGNNIVNNQGLFSNTRPVGSSSNMPQFLSPAPLLIHSDTSNIRLDSNTIPKDIQRFYSSPAQNSVASQQITPSNNTNEFGSRIIRPFESPTDLNSRAPSHSKFTSYYPETLLSSVTPEVNKQILNPNIPQGNIQPSIINILPLDTINQNRPTLFGGNGLSTNNLNVDSQPLNVSAKPTNLIFNKVSPINKLSKNSERPIKLFSVLSGFNTPQTFPNFKNSQFIPSLGLYNQPQSSRNFSNQNAIQFKSSISPDLYNNNNNAISTPASNIQPLLNSSVVQNGSSPLRSNSNDSLKQIQDPSPIMIENQWATTDTQKQPNNHSSGSNIPLENKTLFSGTNTNNLIRQPGNDYQKHIHFGQIQRPSSESISNVPLQYSSPFLNNIITQTKQYPLDTSFDYTNLGLNPSSISSKYAGEPSKGPSNINPGSLSSNIIWDPSNIQNSSPRVNQSQQSIPIKEAPGSPTRLDNVESPNRTTPLQIPSFSTVTQTNTQIITPETSRGPSKTAAPSDSSRITNDTPYGLNSKSQVDHSQQPTPKSSHLPLFQTDDLTNPGERVESSSTKIGNKIIRNPEILPAETWSSKIPHLFKSSVKSASGSTLVPLKVVSPSSIYGTPNGQNFIPSVILNNQSAHELTLPQFTPSRYLSNAVVGVSKSPSKLGNMKQNPTISSGSGPLSNRFPHSQTNDNINTSEAPVEPSKVESYPSTSRNIYGTPIGPNANSNAGLNKKPHSKSSTSEFTPLEDLPNSVIRAPTTPANQENIINKNPLISSESLSSSNDPQLPGNNKIISSEPRLGTSKDSPAISGRPQIISVTNNGSISKIVVDPDKTLPHDVNKLSQFLPTFDLSEPVTADIGRPTKLGNRILQNPFITSGLAPPSTSSNKQANANLIVSESPARPSEVPFYSVDSHTGYATPNAQNSRPQQSALESAPLNFIPTERLSNKVIQPGSANNLGNINYRNSQTAPKIASPAIQPYAFNKIISSESPLVSDYPKSRFSDPQTNNNIVISESPIGPSNVSSSRGAYGAPTGQNLNSVDVNKQSKPESQFIQPRDSPNQVLGAPGYPAKHNPSFSPELLQSSVFSPSLTNSKTTASESPSQPSKVASPLSSSQITYDVPNGSNLNPSVNKQPTSESVSSQFTPTKTLANTVLGDSGIPTKLGNLDSRSPPLGSELWPSSPPLQPQTNSLSNTSESSNKPSKAASPSSNSSAIDPKKQSVPESLSQFSPAKTLATFPNFVGDSGIPSKLGNVGSRNPPLGSELWPSLPRLQPQTNNNINTPESSNEPSKVAPRSSNSSATDTNKQSVPESLSTQFTPSKTLANTVFGDSGNPTKLGNVGSPNPPLRSELWPSLPPLQPQTISQINTSKPKVAPPSSSSSVIGANKQSLPEFSSSLFISSNDSRNIVLGVPGIPTKSGNVLPRDPIIGSELQRSSTPSKPRANGPIIVSGSSHEQLKAGPSSSSSLITYGSPMDQNSSPVVDFFQKPVSESPTSKIIPSKHLSYSINGSPTKPKNSQTNSKIITVESPLKQSKIPTPSSSSIYGPLNVPDDSSPELDLINQSTPLSSPSQFVSSNSSSNEVVGAPESPTNQGNINHYPTISSKLLSTSKFPYGKTNNIVKPQSIITPSNITHPSPTSRVPTSQFIPTKDLTSTALASGNPLNIENIMNQNPSNSSKALTSPSLSFPQAYSKTITPEHFSGSSKAATPSSNTRIKLDSPNGSISILQPGSKRQSTSESPSIQNLAASENPMIQGTIFNLKQPNSPSLFPHSKINNKIIPTAYSLMPSIVAPHSSRSKSFNSPPNGQYLSTQVPFKPSESQMILAKDLPNTMSLTSGYPTNRNPSTVSENSLTSTIPLPLENSNIDSSKSPLGSSQLVSPSSNTFKSGSPDLRPEINRDQQSTDQEPLLNRNTFQINPITSSVTQAPTTNIISHNKSASLPDLNTSKLRNTTARPSESSLQFLPPNNLVKPTGSPPKKEERIPLINITTETEAPSLSPQQKNNQIFVSFAPAVPSMLSSVSSSLSTTQDPLGSPNSSTKISQVNPTHSPSISEYLLNMSNKSLPLPTITSQNSIHNPISQSNLPGTYPNPTIIASKSVPSIPRKQEDIGNGVAHKSPEIPFNGSSVSLDDRQKHNPPSAIQKSQGSVIYIPNIAFLPDIKSPMVVTTSASRSKPESNEDDDTDESDEDSEEEPITSKGSASILPSKIAIGTPQGTNGQEGPAESRTSGTVVQSGVQSPGGVVPAAIDVPGGGGNPERGVKEMAGGLEKAAPTGSGGLGRVVSASAGFPGLFTVYPGSVVSGTRLGLIPQVTSRFVPQSIPVLVPVQYIFVELPLLAYNSVKTFIQSPPSIGNAVQYVCPSWCRSRF